MRSPTPSDAAHQPASGLGDSPASPAGAHHHHALALKEARGHLRRWTLELLGYLALAYLLLRLTPSLKQAFHSLSSVQWPFMVGVFALETLSEIGFVLAWRAIVDRDKVLERDGRGHRTATRAAWAQLGAGLLLPGGSFSGIGAGAWILHRLGLPLEVIAERQFSLSFLNTAVDAIVLVFFGLGLALGVFTGTGDLALTVVPAAVAIAGITAALYVANRATQLSQRVRGNHPRIAGAVESVANAVEDTDRVVFHRGDWRSLMGAIAYLGFDVLVLFFAFFALHAHPVPAFAPVLMAYLIGALGGSLPLPAGVGAIGGIGGVLTLYGVRGNPAVGAALLYGAIGLLVPLIGGAIAYAFLRRELTTMLAAQKAG